MVSQIPCVGQPSTVSRHRSSPGAPACCYRAFAATVLQPLLLKRGDFRLYHLQLALRGKSDLAVKLKIAAAKKTTEGTEKRA